MDAGLQAGYFEGAWRFVRQHPGWTIMSGHIGTDHLLPGGGGLEWADALIGGFYSEEARRMAAALPIPVVNVIEQPAGGGEDASLPCVSIDNRRVGAMAFEHLRSMGLRRFAYLPWDRGPDSSARWEGWYDAAADAGFGDRTQRLPNHLSTTTWTQDLQKQATILAAIPRPYGLFCFSDWLANLALLALQVAGCRVPDDVAVVGVDNEALLCESSTPPLSSVDPFPQRVGHRAAERVTALADRGEAPAGRGSGVVRVPPRVVVARASTDVVLAEDEDVAEAMRYIREAAAAESYPDAEEVAAAAERSRRQLDAKFRAQLGHTVAGEVRRRRILAITQLLREDELPLSEIAARTQCGSLSQLCRVVRRHTGLSPLAYREANTGRVSTVGEVEAGWDPENDA